MFELSFLLFFLIIISFIMISTLKIGISPMPSSKKVCEMFLVLASKSEEKNIIDIGSGFGFLIIYLAKNLSNKNFVAYEISLFPYLFSLLLKKAFKLTNLQIYKKDFLKEDLSNSLVFCYLFPKGMQDLEEKIKKEGLKIKLYSSTFAFRNIFYEEVYRLQDLYKTPIFSYDLSKNEAKN